MKRSTLDVHNIYEQYSKHAKVIGEVVTITTDLSQAATARSSSFPPAPGISSKPSDQNFNSNIISSGKSKEELQRDANNFKKLIELTNDVKLDQETRNKIDNAKSLLLQYSMLYGIKPTN